MARRGLRGALTLRARAGVSRESPISVYDLAERLDVDVRFLGGSSFGGMYGRNSKTVLVPALRPPGRQAFTCAHELGHWHFNHGTRLHALPEIGQPFRGAQEERLANIFAGYLLMPPWAVESVFAQRGWEPNTCTPLQMSICAGQLGVGYGSLIQHLKWSLRLLCAEQAQKLEKKTPKQLRREVLQDDIAEALTDHLVVVDSHWNTVAVDLRVGDIAILPEGVEIEGGSVRQVGEHALGIMVQGRRPGLSRAESSDGSWSTYIRVRRKEYTGCSIYRHLEDPDLEESDVDFAS